jgi:hypothetical protein
MRSSEGRAGPFIAREIAIERAVVVDTLPSGWFSSLLLLRASRAAETSAQGR